MAWSEGHTREHVPRRSMSEIARAKRPGAKGSRMYMGVDGLGHAYVSIWFGFSRIDRLYMSSAWSWRPLDSERMRASCGSTGNESQVKSSASTSSLRLTR